MLSDRCFPKGAPGMFGLHNAATKQEQVHQKEPNVFYQVTVVETYISLISALDTNAISPTPTTSSTPTTKGAYKPQRLDICVVRRCSEWSSQHTSAG
ncbi:hypothetical protein I7I48_01205 [Histoplasma ohiense]|nr:hypothetical protein I7I48_01205 [Histoplasma ohiense (nom. inval.)]